jgi:hypothetical protein
MKRTARRRGQTTRSPQNSPTTVDVTVERLEILGEQLTAASQESQAIARVVRADLTDALQNTVIDPMTRKKID